MRFCDPKKLVLGTIIIMIAALTTSVVSKQYSSNMQRVESSSTDHRRLPGDVEGVMKGFSYTDNDNGTRITINGKMMVLRGSKLLGLRSNVLKSIYLQDMEGAINSSKTSLTFSASEAEWDANSAHPLLLKKNVILTFNRKDIPHVRSAKIYLKERIMEVSGHQKAVYQLK